MSKRLTYYLPLLLVGLLGCSLPTGGMQTPPETLPAVTETPFQPAEITPLPELVIVTPDPTSTPTITPTSIATTSPQLTLEQLKNGEYASIGVDGSITRTYRLENGSYRSSTDTSAQGYVSISLGQAVGFGSLDNAEGEDAAVILAENYGGTGQFVQVGAILNRTGLPYHAASYPLGDRTVVNSLTIQNNEIIADAIVHGPNDGMCCPSVPAKIHLRLLNPNRLMLTRFTTKTPTGQERAINIRAPLSGAEVSGSVTLTGDVTIAPFENNLTYTVYNSEYREITRSYLMVDAPDFGAPGTFAITIDLSSLGRSGDIYIEITDLSAADGSVLALSQVQLKVR